MGRSSKKHHSGQGASTIKLITGFAVLGLAAGLIFRKRGGEGPVESAGARPIDEEFSDIARGNSAQVPGVDPLPPREPM